MRPPDTVNLSLMHLGGVSGPQDEVGTDLGLGQAAVRAHGRREDRRNSPDPICCFLNFLRAALE